MTSISPRAFVSSIRFMCLAPQSQGGLSASVSETPILDGLGSTEEQVEQVKAGLAAAVPMGLMGTSDEIAKDALFLASDDSSFVTGIEHSSPRRSRV